MPSTEGDLREQAEGIIQDWCGWHIAPVRTETVKVVSAGSALQLRSMLVTAVASVVRDGQTLTGWSWDSRGRISLTSWHDDRIGHHDCWEHHHHVGSAIYDVTFTHGFARVPPAVAGVFRGLVSRGANDSAYTRIGPFEWARSADGAPLGSSLTLADKAALAPYRLPSQP